MKKLEQKILYCLEKYPETCNSDTKLTNAIWLEFYKDKLFASADGQASVKLIDLYELPTQDDVKRIRAKIQNEQHLFLPTSEKVRRQRKIKEEDWRKYLGYNPELRTI